MKNDQYRLALYKRFAEEANHQGIKWVVLHGDEGYPTTIGRDLDVMCESEELSFNLMRIFENVAKQNPQTGWIVFPNPIWGHRVLAISKNFEVAELHDIGYLCTGVISCRIDYSDIEYSYVFPTNKKATEFKAVVMPLLGNNKKVLSRISDTEAYKICNALGDAYKHLRNEGKISVSDRIRIYCHYRNRPVEMLNNLIRTIKRKKDAYDAVTTPIVDVSGITYDICLLENLLSEVFFDFVDGNTKKQRELNYDRARQRLVYFDTQNRNTDVVVEGLSAVDDAKNIIDRFSEFNLQYSKF